jgi:hypothetical protein
MCEILVRVVDKPSDSVFQRLNQNCAGDVVVIVEDGHLWGSEEVSNPDWRIFQLPGLPVAALSDMTQPRRNPKQADRTTAKKKLFFSLGDEWLRGVIASGMVIKFTDVEASKLLALKTIKTQEPVVILGD